MHSYVHVLAATLALSGTAWCQAWYIPDNVASTGGCNVIPFGDILPSATWSNQKYQTVILASDLGSVPGLITGIAFAPCGSGDRDFDSLQIVLDHLPATSTLSTTFAANLTANAVTVLNATNFTWRQTADTWNNIGLQNYFVFNGLDNVVIEITAFNGRGNVSVPQINQSGIRTGARQRLYAFTWTGTPPPTGTLGSSAALKMEVTMLMARTSLHGRGCPQSNGVRPNHVYSGAPQLGQTLNFDLQGALPNSLAVLAAGTYNGFPFPLDLATYGFSGCLAYFAIANSLVMLASPGGTATASIGVPNAPVLAGGQMFTQYFCLDTGTNRLSNSNYGAILIGN